jgi:hypothetical protein
VAQRPDAIDARLPALPIGHLGDETLRNIVTGRLVHFRTGPWVALEEDGSRVVRVMDGSEPSLFADVPRTWAAQTAPPSTPARTVVLGAGSRLTRTRRQAASRRHRTARR